MKKFKKSLELNKEFVNNISSEELESLMAEFDKYEKSIQLMQTAVVGQGEQLKPKKEICYKSNEPCKFNCAGLCRDSC